MPINARLSKKAKKNYLAFFLQKPRTKIKPLSATQIKNIANTMKYIIEFYKVPKKNPVIKKFYKAYKKKDYEKAVKEIVVISLKNIKLTITQMKNKTSKPAKTLETYFGYLKEKNQTLNKSISDNLAEDLELNVCPYCNRNFINQKRGIELDHYFSKSQYPLFAISFYNLIPCCHSCNNSKSDEPLAPDKLPNPYEISTSNLPIRFNADLGSTIQEIKIKTLFSDVAYEYGYNSILGIKDTYNKPGTSGDKNWSLRLPNNFEEIYFQNIKPEGLGLNLPLILKMAIEARGSKFASKHKGLLKDLQELI